MGTSKPMAVNSIAVRRINVDMLKYDVTTFVDRTLKLVSMLELIRVNSVRIILNMFTALAQTFKSRL